MQVKELNEWTACASSLVICVIGKVSQKVSHYLVGPTGAGIFVFMDTGLGWRRGCVALNVMPPTASSLPRTFFHELHRLVRLAHC